MEEHGYTVIRVLGQGGSCQSRVYEVRNSEGRLRVVKQLPWLSEANRENALREVELLASLRHPCIVPYLESFLVRSSPSLPLEDVLCLVMARCERDLRQECLRFRLDWELKQEQAGAPGDGQPPAEEPPGPPRFSEAQVLSWLAQLCWGLQHLHSKKLLHRDLKPQNVLLTYSGKRAMLADFGVCGQVDHTEDMRHSIVGTPAFMSPEMLQGRPYGLKTDQWALGCILYETMALEPPFAGRMESYAAVVNAVLHAPPVQSPPGYTKGLSNAVEALLARKPHERPSNRDLLRGAVLRQPFQGFLGTLNRSANRRANGVGAAEVQEGKNGAGGRDISNAAGGEGPGRGASGGTWGLQAAPKYGAGRRGAPAAAASVASDAAAGTAAEGAVQQAGSSAGSAAVTAILEGALTDDGAADGGGDNLGLTSMLASALSSETPPPAPAPPPMARSACDSGRAQVSQVSSSNGGSGNAEQDFWAAMSAPAPAPAPLVVDSGFCSMLPTPMYSSPTAASAASASALLERAAPDSGPFSAPHSDAGVLSPMSCSAGVAGGARRGTVGIAGAAIAGAAAAGGGGSASSTNIGLAAVAAGAASAPGVPPPVPSPDDSLAAALASGDSGGGGGGVGGGSPKPRGALWRGVGGGFAPSELEPAASSVAASWEPDGPAIPSSSSTASPTAVSAGRLIGGVGAGLPDGHGLGGRRTGWVAAAPSGATVAAALAPPPPPPSQPSKVAPAPSSQAMMRQGGGPSRSPPCPASGTFDNDAAYSSEFDSYSGDEGKRGNDVGDDDGEGSVYDDDDDEDDGVEEGGCYDDEVEEEVEQQRRMVPEITNGCSEWLSDFPGDLAGDGVEGEPPEVSEDVEVDGFVGGGLGRGSGDEGSEIEEEDEDEFEEDIGGEETLEFCQGSASFEVNLGHSEWGHLIDEAEALLRHELDDDTAEPGVACKRLREAVSVTLGGSARVDQALAFLRERRPLGETLEADELMLQVELDDLLGDDGLQALPLLERLVELEGAAELDS